MKKALGVVENLHRPYDYAVDDLRKKIANDLIWKKERAQLDIENTKKM